MKHKLISCISVLLVVLITFGTGAFSAATLDTSTEVSSKISPNLQSKLSEMSDDDTVEVAVWLNHTDEETLKNAYKNELQKSINRGIITTDIATATALFDESSHLEIEPLSIEKTQQLLSIRRSAYSNIITINNINWQNYVKPYLKDDVAFVYSSTSAPVVIMKVTKDDIKELETLKHIENIYYYTNKQIPPTVSSSTNEDTKSTPDYTTWQNVCSSYTLRDVMGYTGAGIKIGMLENGYPNKNAVSLNTQTNKIMPLEVSGDDGHATYVASILLGKTAQYTGVAPNATLFCGAARYGIIEAIDLLVVDNDVNILTISIALGAHLNTATGEIYGVFNTYDFYAKYLDYISYTFGVSVCIASGNYGVSSSSVPSGLAEGAMSYNSITVGNIAVSGAYPNTTLTLESDSSYINSSKKAYKPDLCAPGNGVVTPYSAGGGTSAATPVVAGICALLMEADSRLIGRPSLVKSLLLSSTNRISSMGEIYSTTSATPALSRSYGAGMVDAMRAYNLINSNNWRCVEIESALLSSSKYTMNINVTQNDINYNKKIAVSLSWTQKVIYENGTNNVYTVPKYSLCVYNSNGEVAYSYYTYDRKQYIYFEPTEVGTYTIKVERKVMSNEVAPLSMSYYKTN